MILQKVSGYVDLIFSIPIRFSHRAALDRLRGLKHTKRALTALVIGNGPTAKELDFEQVKEMNSKSDFDIFLINYSILDYRLNSLKRFYLVLSDEQMMPMVHSDRNEELWRVIRESSGVTLITPTTWHKKFQELSCTNNDCLHFDDTALVGITKNISPMRPYGYTPLTAYKALSVAGFLGYNQILIIGIDNSMFRSISVDDTNSLVETENHSIGNYKYSRKYTRELMLDSRYGISDYFYQLSLTYSSLKRYFKELPITNLGLQSEVDAFPKVGENSPWRFLVKNDQI